jgi:hypothetical protein
LRVVVSGRGHVNPNARLFRQAYGPIIILATQRISKARLRRLQSLAHTVKICGGEQVDFAEALRWLRSEWNVRDLLCEGGGVVVAAGRKSLLDLLAQVDTAADDSVIFDKFSVTGEAVLAPGRTLILSGLDQKERRTGESGVPFLSSIPVLKWFFSQTTRTDVDTSVIILLTPRDPSYLGARNRAELETFVTMRRAFVKARQGTPADFQAFEERFPNWREIPPNRFASHFFLLANSELYRAFSGDTLTEEDLELDILGAKIRP